MNAILVTEDWPSDRDKESGVTVQDLTQVVEHGEILPFGASGGQKPVQENHDPFAAIDRCREILERRTSSEQKPNEQPSRKLP